MTWIIPVVSADFFTEKEHETLGVLFDAIFPGGATEGVPTTRVAGVVGYLNRLLSCDEAIYWEIPKWRIMYRDGLQALDEYSIQHYGLSCKELDRNQATELLEGLRQQTLGISLLQKRFFDTLRVHCIQGCFSDPAWGGNRGTIMWRWLGYMGPAEDFHG